MQGTAAWCEAAPLPCLPCLRSWECLTALGAILFSFNIALIVSPGKRQGSGRVGWEAAACRALAPLAAGADAPSRHPIPSSPLSSPLTHTCLQLVEVQDTLRSPSSEAAAAASPAICRRRGDDDAPLSAVAVEAAGPIRQMRRAINISMAAMTVIYMAVAATGYAGEGRGLGEAGASACLPHVSECAAGGRSVARSPTPAASALPLLPRRSAGCCDTAEHP